MTIAEMYPIMSITQIITVMVNPIIVGPGCILKISLLRRVRNKKAKEGIDGINNSAI
jgi:hypothetical protein